MSTVVNEFVYPFGELVFVGRRPENRSKTVWYLECPDCGKRHVFRHPGTKIWHTSCEATGYEWTITPAEYYVLKPADFSLIMGDI